MNKWLCILIVTALVVSPFMFLSGCAGAFIASPEKQAAYDDYVTKAQKLGESQVRMEQLNTSLCNQLQGMDYDFSNEAEAYVALGKLTASIDILIDEMDVFITDCDNAIAASQKYRTYLNPNSNEYKQILNNETELTNVVQEARDLKAFCIYMKGFITELNIWMQKMMALVDKFEECPKLQTGPEIYTWFATTRPVLDGYIAESNIIVNMTDDMVKLGQKNNMSTEKIVGYQQMKNTVITTNSEIVSSYNVLVDAYNSRYGSAFGQVSKA